MVRHSEKKKYSIKKILSVMLGLHFLMLIFASMAFSDTEPSVTVRVTIEHVSILTECCDCWTAFPSCDFYAKIKIDGGAAHVFGVYDDDNNSIYPNWTFSKEVPLSKGSVPVQIEVRDSDWGTDDWVGIAHDDDYNPLPRLDLEVNLLRPDCCSIYSPARILIPGVGRVHTADCYTSLGSDGWSSIGRGVIRFKVEVIEPEPSNDNCPNEFNPCQEDWDNDGEGDACDCNDNFMGSTELGADCGGPYCSLSCADKYGSNCIPIIDNQESYDEQKKIDVVFIPDEDYYDLAEGNEEVMDIFLRDAQFLVHQGYFGADEFYERRCKFNFYYYSSAGVEDAGDYEPVCEKWDVPPQFVDECSFADSVAIVFNGGGRACSGHRFSTPPRSSRTAVHESGHNIFGLPDEYCCDGGYWQPSTPYPSIFHSKSDCEALSQNPSGCTNNFCPEQDCTWPSNADCIKFAVEEGLDETKCIGTCSPKWCDWRGEGYRECCVDGGDGWWKSDPNTCYMESGMTFGPDCSSSVIYQLNTEYDMCVNPGDSASGGYSYTSSPGVQDESTKVIILEYEIDEDMISLLASRVVYNRAPDHLRKDGEFDMSIVSSGLQELRMILLHDPRELHIFGHEDEVPGMMMRDYASFTVVLPFMDYTRYIEIRNSETGEVLHVADLSELITDFCREDNYQDLQCEISDLDNDDVPDRDDNCLLDENHDQKDFDQDDLGDVCDPDDDNDGVLDEQDACPYTNVPESVPTEKMGILRWALVDGDNIFDTNLPRGGGKGPRLSFTTTDTSGCSCEQIIGALGLGHGHRQFGCSISAMQSWVEMVNSE